MSAGKPLQSQKVWFLYVVDHHEGPFTVEEIKAKVKKGEAAQTSYVWKDPMPDWVVMEEEPEFNLSKSQNAISTSQSSAAAVLGFKTGAPVKSSGFSFSSLFSKNKTGTSGRKSSSVPLLLIFMMLVGGYQYAALKKKELGLTPLPLPKINFQKTFGPLIAKLPPQIKKLIGGVELPEDTPEKDREVLAEAANASLEEGGRIALTLAGGDVFNPEFILASNLPNGTNIDLILKGKKGALLNSQGIELRTSATINNQVARSRKFNLGELKSLPTGEYTLLAFDSDKQSPEISLALAAAPRKAAPSSIPQGKTAFSIEGYFLGGKRNPAFDAKLKEYNSKVTARSGGELVELKQLHDTLENMANESATRFFKSAPKQGKASKSVKTEWKKYSTEYLKMSSQIKTLLSTPAPQAEPGLPSRFFPAIYTAANAAFDLSERLHNTETVFYEGKSTMPQIQELATQTIEALNKFKTLLEEAAK